MKKQNLKVFRSIVLVFILLNAFIIIFRSLLERNGFDQEFLLIANLVLFIITITGVLIQLRGLASPNPQAFIRGVYASLIIKMFVVMAAVFVYAFLNKEKINKPSIFTSVGMYIVYTVVEVITLMKSAKNNAG